jgi:hypothetical protein
MSDYKAIRGVSSSLRTLLKDRMESPVPVLLAPPDVAQASNDGKRLNLYLYQVTQNRYLENQEIPGTGHPADYGTPPLSLDLYYLLTSYGDSDTGADADLEAQEVLGDAMRVLHDFPVITPDLHQADDAARPLILDSTLVDDFERIKVTLQPLTIDHLSKLWSAIPAPGFRRAAGYQASVVQIESRKPRRIASPVQTRRLHVAVSRRPEIDAVYRTPGAGEPTGDGRVAIGGELTIEGRNFRAANTYVVLGALEPIRVQPVHDGLIRIELPDSTYPVDGDHPAVRPIPAAARLAAGPQALAVLTTRSGEVVAGGLDAGAVSADDALQSSNESVFMLVPTLVSVSPASGATATALLTLTGTRLYRHGRKSVVLVGDAVLDVREPAPGDAWAAPSDASVQVPLAQLAALPSPLDPGTHAVRVRSNGAQGLETHDFTVTA